MSGNLDTDLLFENGYYLSEDSPAIGAGTSTDAPETDLDGNPRPNPQFIQLKNTSQNNNLSGHRNLTGLKTTTLLASALKHADNQPA